ncbi:ATP-grasp domain-containing protein, partial [Shimia sp.]|uniref:ATP-grasp domain-containing protein n=1 Tax=Shimia sp. TaxID=1954381 RepID=UPI003566994C
MTEPLKPGATIGILGGGQLGRMLSVAAARLGYVTHVFEPGANPPAGHVAQRVTTASYEDAEALRAFAAEVDVITYEFENIPTSALDILEAHCPIRPGREALRVSQDRLTEKEFLKRLGLETAPFAAVETRADLAAAVDAIGAPAILKTRRFGYDGKGQYRVTTRDDIDAAWRELAGAALIAEEWLDFDYEVSAIGV